MKRILFDQQIFRKQDFGGISKYFTELMTGINKQKGYEVFPKKFYSNNTYLSQNNLTSFNWLKNADNFRWKAKIEKLILKTETRHIFNTLKKGKFDIFHPTYYDPSFLKYIPENKPFVLTVHDMIHESYYDKMLEYLSEDTKHKMALIPRAAHIIAVSQYTKNEILKYFPEISENKITVIYHATNLQVQPGTVKPAVLPDNYLLYIGIKKHYKNFFWMVEAVEDYLKQNNIILLCAGGMDFDAYEENFLSRLDLKSHVRHIPINTDADLVDLFKHAICFVFPSLTEGFGIPILESFACGCPAVIANSSCFPEIAGDAALYFEPGSKNSLVERIDNIRHNAVLRKELCNKGMERLKMFSWENTIAQHIKVYESLIN